MISDPDEKFKNVDFYVYINNKIQKRTVYIQIAVKTCCPVIAETGVFDIFTF